ncbi:hypothetical protein [Segatella buccae]|uniref:hypothetical protein n=1 Tax=Segatella buccae TaxID=28126 RepID=UPI0006609CE5|nr:hypothetical protein [Segatella buccae]
MNKMKKYVVLLAIAIVPLAFASCDDADWYDGDPWWYSYYGGGYSWNNDYYNNGGYYNGGGYENNGLTTLDEAQVLAGEWDGKVDYTNGITGEVSQFYANMTFVQNNSTAIKGTGTERDYDGNGNSQILRFSWYIDINNGDIHIRYTDSKNEFVMDYGSTNRGFWLNESSGTFGGYMMGTNNRDMVYIDLTRVTAGAKATRAGVASNSTATTMTATTGKERFFGSRNVVKPRTSDTKHRLVKH